ncbi:MAG: hypothetical protein EAX95_14905 [Candidatus Thorarchaeota archaeon]|nr:hypothetical protein [Candidatus Thorarchaeota archaeon]
MEITGFYDRYWDPMSLHNSSDALARGVASSFTAPNGAVGYATEDGTDVAGDALSTIAVHKIMGSGHVVLLGFDMYEREVNCEQMLANSIRLHRHVVFDASHSPYDTIFADYSDFADDLVAEGFAVSSMGTFDSAYFAASEVLVLTTGTTNYTIAEANTIEAFVKAGGGLFVATDYGPYGEELDPVTERFGFMRNKTSYLTDSDDTIAGDSYNVYDGDNIANHSITLDVNRIELDRPGGFLSLPSGAVTLATTDSDGTSTWAGDGSPADGVPLAAAITTAGFGRVAVVSDMNFMADNTNPDADGETTYHDSDNDVFLINNIRWLSAAGIEEQIVLFDQSNSPILNLAGSYFDFATFLTLNGFTIKWMSTFYESLLSDADVLAISEGYYTVVNYTAADIVAIESFVVGGGGLFLLNDWGQYSYQTGPIIENFGLVLNTTSYLEDSDNTIYGDSYNFYEGEDILSHPITTGVNRIELDRSTGFASIGSASPLAVTDDDGTCTWYSDGSPANGVVVAAARAYGMGRVVVIPDVNVAANSLDVDGDGLGQMYAADNEVFLRNAFLWLSANRAPSVTVTFPNGGEVLNGTQVITWNAVDFDSDPMTFDVYYSDNNGTDWTSLALGLTVQEFSWNTTQHDDGNSYMVKVVVSDGEFIAEDTSNNPFELDNFQGSQEIPFDPTLLIIIIAAAGVVIIILIVIMKKKK